MIPAEMVLGFLSSAKTNKRRIKISGTEDGAVKGFVRDVKMEDKVITIDVDGEVVVMDMNICEAKTSFFDHRVIHVVGEEHYKIQLI